MKRIRCAIYTRKSSEDGLEQDFNSLDAQREACEAFIASQKQEGWELLPERFDDGGISGGHLDRPALQHLMQAVDDGQIDQIVVYKIDRLTRSLADFAKLVERLDAAKASFVSVTQSFNTATSMGRLTLNLLLSFAQFEREVTAERIRDKIAAYKRRGLWMGGNEPLGYRADGRTLAIHEPEAGTVRKLYDMYLEHSNIRLVQEKANALGLRSRKRVRAGGRVSGGTPLNRGHNHHILTNPIYAGRIRHKDQVHEGKHPAIIVADLWDHVQVLLAENSAKDRGHTRRMRTSLLAGKLFDETGDRLTPSHTKKNGKRLRYYVSHRLVTGCAQDHPDGWRLPAQDLETGVAEAIKRHLGQPSILGRLTHAPTASWLQQASTQLKDLNAPKSWLALAERIDIQSGKMRVQLDRDACAALLKVVADDIREDSLAWELPFRTRKRGVETKLHLGVETPANIDQTLVQNIIKAQDYLHRIITGQTFAEIAAAEATSKRRIQDLVDLALLSPDILGQIASDTQPEHLTTDYLLKTGFSADWSEQAAQFAIA